jgi:hypothetical protein
MSSKVSKSARKVGIKAARREALKIANEQIIELFKSPLWIRIKFAIRVVFKR